MMCFAHDHLPRLQWFRKVSFLWFGGQGGKGLGMGVKRFDLMLGPCWVLTVLICLHGIDRFYVAQLMR